MSLRVATAMALAGVNTGGLASYSEATAADPTLIALRDKVEFDFQNGRPNTIADLELVLTDGRRVTATHDSGVPATDIAEQGRRLEEKFTSLAEPILGGATTRDLIGEIGTFDALGDLRGERAAGARELVEQLDVAFIARGGGASGSRRSHDRNVVGDGSESVPGWRGAGPTLVSIAGTGVARSGNRPAQCPSTAPTVVLTAVRRPRAIRGDNCCSSAWRSR